MTSWCRNHFKDQLQQLIFSCCPNWHLIYSHFFLSLSLEMNVVSADTSVTEISPHVLFINKPVYTYSSMYIIEKYLGSDMICMSYNITVFHLKLHCATRYKTYYILRLNEIAIYVYSIPVLEIQNLLQCAETVVFRKYL